MRALITGAGGFVGGHLSAYLLAHTDWELMGTVYPHPVEVQPQEPRLRLQHADLRDPQVVQALVAEVQPDYVFHLAAQSFVPTSFADPWDTLENNIRAQLNLLEAVRQWRFEPATLDDEPVASLGTLTVSIPRPLARLEQLRYSVSDRKPAGVVARLVG